MMNSRNKVYATLTPGNALARLALSDAYDALTAGRQHASDGRGPLCRMEVNPEQVYDDEMCKLRRELERKLQLGDGFTSDSLTEPFSGGEDAASILQLGKIWTGQYLLGLMPWPLPTEMGWRAGKGRLPASDASNGYPHLLLCTAAFAKKHNINLRTIHARFNFDLHNRALFIVGKSGSQNAQLAINGTIVGGRMSVLNQNSMTIDCDRLKYTFEYTEWALTSDFETARREYMTEAMKAPKVIDCEMPTPLGNVRTVGQWTLSKPLGRGGMGRVFLASNAQNETTAVKIVERNERTEASVDREIGTSQKLTALHKQYYEGEDFFVQVREVIDMSSEITPPRCTLPFREVAIVMVPMTPFTLSDLIDRREDHGRKGMPAMAVHAFRNALVCLQALHSKGWLHGDLKPPNIGVIGLTTAPRSVLLDVGHATYLKTNATLRPTPGDGGTLGYLAP